jgi:hypothetical protein
VQKGRVIEFSAGLRRRFKFLKMSFVGVESEFVTKLQHCKLYAYGVRESWRRIKGRSMEKKNQQSKLI